MAGLVSSVSTWFVVVAVAAMTGAFYVHERRDAQRFEELAQRIDELRLAQPSNCEKGAVRAVAPSLDGLAEAVASRIATRWNEGQTKPADLAGASASARSDEPEEDPAPTPEQQRLVNQAVRVAEAALRSGRLKRSDVEELRGLFGSAGPAPEQLELRERIIKAINAQKLTVEDPAFILF